MRPDVVLHFALVVPALVGAQHLLVTRFGRSVSIFISAARIAGRGAEGDRVVCRIGDRAGPERGAARLVIGEDVRVLAPGLCDGGVY